MTKKQCEIKVKEMMADIRQSVILESCRLMNTGGIDMKNYANNFMAPRIVLTVALENVAARLCLGFFDTSKGLAHQDLKNLRRF